MEEIRERLSKLERSNWAVTFVWVMSHAGILETNWLINWPKQLRGTKI